MATTLAAIRITQGALKTLVLRPYSRSVLIFKSSAGDFHVQPKLRPKAQYNQFIVGETSAREQMTIKQVTLPSCQVASVVSNSVRPHGLQPTRLLCPWDSPGKITGVGCHFLLQCMKVESESEVTQLCLTLRDPMDCSPPGSSIHGIFWATVLEWGAIAFS